MKLGVDANDVSADTANILGLEGLKGRCFHVDDVRVWDKVSHRVVATLIGSGFLGGTFGSGGNRNFGTGDGVALRIGHCANDAAIDSLGAS